MKELLADFLDRALRYIENRDSRRVAPSAEAVERLALLDEPLPEHPTDPQIVLQCSMKLARPRRWPAPAAGISGFVTAAGFPRLWPRFDGRSLEPERRLPRQSPVAAAIERCLPQMAA